MKKPVVYAFIDSQNLNLGVRSQGWILDFKKFHDYLRYRYGAKKIFLFIGLLPENVNLYNSLSNYGYHLVFKPVVKTIKKDGTVEVKGNVDAELVLHAAAIEYKNFDQAIIVSGDGDFACLVEFLAERDKLSRVITPSLRYSKLLKNWSGQIVNLAPLKHKLAYHKKSSVGDSRKPAAKTSRNNYLGKKSDRHRRSVEPIGLSGHRDVTSLAKPDAKVKPSFNKVSKKKEV